MALRLPTATRNAKTSASVGRLDAGTGTGHIELRSGSQPADPNTAATGDLLATVNLADPAFGSPASGAAEAQGLPLPFTGVANGEIGWFRAFDSDNNAVFDGSVTATGGGGDLEVNNTNIAVDQEGSVTALTYTQPEA
jgi:hypothetical protein